MQQTTRVCWLAVTVALGSGTAVLGATQLGNPPERLLGPVRLAGRCGRC